MAGLCPRVKGLKIWLLAFIFLFLLAAVLLTQPVANTIPAGYTDAKEAESDTETEYRENDASSPPGRSDARTKNARKRMTSPEDGLQEMDGAPSKGGRNNKQGVDKRKPKEDTARESDGSAQRDEEESEESELYSDDSDGSANAREQNEEEEEAPGGFFGFFESMSTSPWLHPFQSRSTFRDPQPASYEDNFSDGEETSDFGFSGGKEGGHSDIEVEEQGEVDDKNDNEQGEDDDNISTEADDDDDDKEAESDKEYARGNKRKDDKREKQKLKSQTILNEEQNRKSDDKFVDREEMDNDDPETLPEKENVDVMKVEPPSVKKKNVDKAQNSNKQRKSATPKDDVKSQDLAKVSESEITKTVFRPQASKPKLRPQQLSEKELIWIFETKLENATGKQKKLGDTCFDKRTLSNSCEKGQCLQTKLPASPEDRVRQLVNRPGLTLSDSQHAILREMGAKVKNTYDVILLTAASSNHFLESQALLENLHKNVFPVLKNFILLFYDIGLTPSEREELEKYCMCQVLSFPFEKFPKYIRNLKCYAWKPLMIKAHIHQASVVLWLDASIRFNGDSGQLKQLIQRVKERGVQIGSSSSDTTFRTFRSVFHYFGDEPCMYQGMGQAKATIGGYHREPFVDRVVLEPWVACALHQDCMCPDNNLSAGCAESKKMAANVLENNGPIIYGLCHRFDQSVITLILHKLYQAKYPWVMMNVHEYGDIARDHQLQYFKTLKT